MFFSFGDAKKQEEQRRPPDDDDDDDDDDSSSEDSEDAMATWSSMQRGNPFALFGESLGLLATDKLPSFPTLLKGWLFGGTLTLAEASSARADVEEYVESMGYVVTGPTSAKQRPEEQELAVFKEGALDAASFVSTAMFDGTALTRDTTGQALRSKLKKKPSMLLEGPMLTKLVFCVQCRSPWGFEDLVPRSFSHHPLNLAMGRGAGWAPYDVGTTDQGDVVLTEVLSPTVQGEFVAFFTLKPDLLSRVKEWGKKRGFTDSAACLDPYLLSHNLTFPVRDNPEVHGWLVAEVAFAVEGAATADAAAPDEKKRRRRFTFARKIEPGRDSRWDHDWRVVDVDRVVTKGDSHNYDLLLERKDDEDEDDDDAATEDDDTPPPQDAAAVAAAGTKNDDTPPQGEEKAS